MGQPQRGIDHPDHARRSKTLKSRAKKALPTDRIASGKQLALLGAYATASGFSGKAVTTNDVAKVAQMRPNTISGSKGFLVGVAFLHKADDGFLPAEELITFNLP